MSEETAPYYSGVCRFMDKGLAKTALFEDEDDSDSIEENDDSDRQIVVGICAMAKKSRSRPMQEILERLERFHYIKTIIFDEQVIVYEPIEVWPIVDCLISFHSKGFPLDKAVAYSELRKPMVINDLYLQYCIQDRRRVHEILNQFHVEQPTYVVLDRSQDPEHRKLVESEDHIEINDVVFHKPFVEKPISAEDHNVYIYFPSNAGGGSQRLFRKIGNKSSVYSPVSNIRKTGSYIYEEFMPTDGTDVKVYTVGPDYAHAEARKSPALDGKVERGKDGKEIRYPVILSAREKMIARTVCLAFKQTVCGFDLLRANGKSYVCDVNGFSFVKTSKKYYDDCAKVLGSMILRQLAPSRHIPFSIDALQAEDIPIVPTTSGTLMELRCVIAVIRHGDRTPKQKMKMEVRHPKFFELFERYGGYQYGELKLKRPKQLQEILDIARFLLNEIKARNIPELEEKQSKLEQLKAVLEMYGHFSGINRKVQLKYQPKGAPSMTKSSDEDDMDALREPSLVLILKWGGELTHIGKIQAEELGKAFRLLYPGGVGESGIAPGLGLLRLHSTFRHDLKIYASDEGRVQMTAAAFAKGLLALEGELPPILAQMVKSANMNGLLDDACQSPKVQRSVKERLQELLNQDKQLTEEDIQEIAPTGAKSMIDAMNRMNNPFRMCESISNMASRLLDRVNELKQEWMNMKDTEKQDAKLYHMESWELMERRWGKLIKDFKMKTGQYDISKIPDIYDCIKYDLLHNQHLLQFDEAEELHLMSKIMADVVIPQEYGISVDEKLAIAQSICTPLLRKILADLDVHSEEEATRLDTRYSKDVASPHRHVKTRLYFTSESHIHSFLTALHYGGLCDQNTDEQWARAMDYVNHISELNYMTQIVIMCYENPAKSEDSDERYHVELHFSPGAQSPHEFLPKYTNSLGYRSQIDEQVKELEKERESSQHSSISAVNPPLAQRTSTAPGTLVEEEPGTVQATSQQVVSSNPSLDPMPIKECSSCESSAQPYLSDDGGMDKEFFLQHVAYSMAKDSSGSLPTVAAKPSYNRSSSGSSSNAKSVTFADKFEDSNLGGIQTSNPSLASIGKSDALDITGSRSRHHSGGIIENEPETATKDKPGEGESVRPSSYENGQEEAFDKKIEQTNRSQSLGENVSSGESLNAQSRRTSLQDFFNNLAEQDKVGPRFISTKVISGSSSAPDLLKENLSSSYKGIDGWQVSNVRPLETLHNALTLRQVQRFLCQLSGGAGFKSASSTIHHMSSSQESTVHLEESCHTKVGNVHPSHHCCDQPNTSGATSTKDPS